MPNRIANQATKINDNNGVKTELASHISWYLLLQQQKNKNKKSNFKQSWIRHQTPRKRETIIICFITYIFSGPNACAHTLRQKGRLTHTHIYTHFNVNVAETSWRTSLFSFHVNESYDTTSSYFTQVAMEYQMYLGRIMAISKCR